MNILITGATGFVGKKLAEKCLQNKFNVAILVRNKKKARHLFGKRCRIILYSKRSESYKYKINKFNPKIVVHLASHLTSSDNKEALQRLLEANIEFTSFLLDSLRDTDVKYFINTGSFSEYYLNNKKLDPAYLYSATKSASRNIIDYYSKILNFTYVNVIPYTIYGLDDSSKKAIDYIIDSLDRRNPIDMTGGSQVLDFIYIDDVVDFYLTLINKIENIHFNSKDYYLGTHRGTSIKSIAKMIENISGKKANINWGKLQYRPRDILHAVASIDRIKKDFNWEPKITLEQGLLIVLKEKINL